MTSTIDTDGARTLASNGDSWKTSPDAGDTKDTSGRKSPPFIVARGPSPMAPHLTSWSPSTRRWIAFVSRDFVGAAARRPKYTPKSRQPRGDIQLKATWGVFCKTVDVNLPWFESRTCHAKAQVNPGVCRRLTHVWERSVTLLPGAVQSCRVSGSSPTPWPTPGGQATRAATRPLRRTPQSLAVMLLIEVKPDKLPILGSPAIVLARHCSNGQNIRFGSHRKLAGVTARWSLVL